MQGSLSTISAWAPSCDTELLLPNSLLQWLPPATSPSCLFSKDWQLHLAPSITYIMTDRFAESQIITVFAVIKFWDMAVKLTAGLECYWSWRMVGPRAFFWTILCPEAAKWVEAGHESFPGSAVVFSLDLGPSLTCDHPNL